jgi:hypothetical protein
MKAVKVAEDAILVVEHDVKLPWGQRLDCV